MTQTIDQTLAERGGRYGEFADHAEVTQSIKVSMQNGRNWYTLPDDMKEALEMVAHKAGRILNGDPDYIDSWTDIIGYIRLVEKRLIAEQAEPQTNRVESIKEALARQAEADDTPCPCLACALKRAVDSFEKVVNLAKPSDEEVRAALKILMAADVITQVDGDA